MGGEGEEASPRLIRYCSYDEDSARWLDFPMRNGDIIISTRSKSGTTWMQMICLLLVFGTPELPEPLHQLSPWLDHLVTPLDEVISHLARQRHRRVVKTHTPLDGLPWREDVFYVVVARHPLDMAVSLYHQGSNLDRTEMARRIGKPEPERSPLPPLREWLERWIERNSDPRRDADGLPGVLAHLTGAWRLRHRENVILVHYDDLSRDLPGEMLRLADRLGILLEGSRIGELARAASFDAMGADARHLAPGQGILKDPSSFFRRGRSGAGRESLGEGGYERYERRSMELAPADLLSWLHR